MTLLLVVNGIMLGALATASAFILWDLKQRTLLRADLAVLKEDISKEIKHVVEVRAALSADIMNIKDKVSGLMMRFELKK
jgi:hypothetical protein